MQAFDPRRSGCSQPTLFPSVALTPDRSPSADRGLHLQLHARNVLRRSTLPSALVRIGWGCRYGFPLNLSFSDSLESSTHRRQSLETTRLPLLSQKKLLE